MAAFAADVGGQRPDEARQLRGRDDNNVGGPATEARGQKPEAGADSSDGAGEEAAAVATVTEPSQSTESNGAPPPPDEEGYVWPEGAASSDSLAAAPGTAQNEPDAPLPSLDDLVKRIPPAAREALDELFRARFVTVKRVDAHSLKS